VHDYAPFYCDENVLRLCPSLGPDAFAVLVTNAARQVEMRRQRAGGRGDGAIVWDYHAFALSIGPRWLVRDFDTTLGWPCHAAEYLRLSFPTDAARAPLFRLVRAGEYSRAFRSDRSHMRGRDGRWLQPPPPWPAPDARGGVRLADLLDPASPCLGQVITWDELRRMVR
jgi:hypothetical protein